MTTVWIIPSRNVSQKISESRRQSILAGMGLVSPFLFFPAHCWLHKNHAKLVEAFHLALPELPGDLKLVFTGRPFSFEHPAAAFIREHGLESRIVHLGFRSPLEIRALFET